MNTANNQSSFEKTVITIFSDLKNEKKTEALPIELIYHQGDLLGILRVVSKSTLDDSDEVKRLAVWRNKNQEWFPSQFTVSVSGTKKWVKDKLLDAKDRMLFMIETPYGKPLGHVGLFRFDFKNQSCEIDNVIRGESLIPGIMTYAIHSLMKWATEYLLVKTFYLEVFADNTRAIHLYERCGFKEIKKIPLKKIVNNAEQRWIEIESKGEAQRYNILMKHLP